MKNLKLFALAALLTTAIMSAPAMANDEYYRSASDPLQATAHYSDTMKMNSHDIANLQRALHKAGYNAGPIDGVVGHRTRSAVKRYQDDFDLIGEGAINDRTLKSLKVKTSRDYSKFRPARTYN